MNTRTRMIAAASGILAVATLAASIPAFAQTSDDMTAAASPAAISASAALKVRVSSSTQAMTAAERAAAMQQRIGNAQDKGSELIDQRIASMNAQLTRIEAMKNVSDSAKATFTASVQAEIASLTSLKAQIAADTSTTSLKADVSSITKAFRIYALVEPQTAIAAAADRIGTITGMISVIQGKLQTRLSAQASVSADVQASMADMTAKTADANVQAQAAVTEVAALKPDNGDQTVMASNTAALKDARAKIQAASKDVMAARKDIDAVTKSLKKTNVTASTTTSTP